MARNGYYTRKHVGLCVCCSTPTTPPYVKCDKCREKTKAYDFKRLSKRREEKLRCKVCDKLVPRNRRRYCEEHTPTDRDNNFKRRERFKVAGKCYRCGISEPIGNILMCEVCWLKETAHNRTGDRSRWQELKQILELQEYKCIYTGKLLIPGENTSLDHIIPISRDGTNNTDNLQWVDFHVNLLKGNYTHSEFVALIKKIYKNVV